MDRKSLWLKYFSLGVFMLLIFVSGTLSAQFEQKLSLNVSAGYFNTIGWSGWEENWEEHGPSLMPNFKGGPSLTAGLQYNFNRHFSMEFQLGFRFAPGWYFDASPDGQEAHNYLHYEIYDDATATMLATGDNYMDMNYMHIGIAPRYYFVPGSRLNPFVYAGLNLNYTDVYFDNVGGEILDAALAKLRMNARIVICGAISQYNNKTAVKGPANYLSLLVNRASMQGMLVMDYAKDYGKAAREMGGWMATGQLKSKEDIYEGIENFHETFARLFNGDKMGKLVLKVL